MVEALTAIATVITIIEANESNKLLNQTIVVQILAPSHITYLIYAFDAVAKSSDERFEVE